jgi:hypothetical protein
VLAYTTLKQNMANEWNKTPAAAPAAATPAPATAPTNTTTSTDTSDRTRCAHRRSVVLRCDDPPTRRVIVNCSPFSCGGVWHDVYCGAMTPMIDAAD